MANEGTATASLKVVKGTGNALFNYSVSHSKIFDVSGTEVADTIYSIGTSAEAVPLGDIGTAGYLWAQNLDTTNYVTLSVETDGTSALVRLNAGDVALFRCAGAPYAMANTAACRVRFLVIES